jgi:hypothetical protein
MARVELRTQARINNKDEVELILRINLVPYGSGNRKLARELADYFKNEPRWKPNLVRVRVGTSSVVMHLKPTPRGFADMLIWWREGMEKRNRERAEAGQMRLQFE